MAVEAVPLDFAPLSPVTDEPGPAAGVEGVPESPPSSVAGVEGVPDTDTTYPTLPLDEPGPTSGVEGVPISGYDIAGVITGRVPFLSAPHSAAEWAQSGFTQRVPFSPMLSVEWILSAPPASDPEGIYHADGRRPAFPLLVYTLVQATSDVSLIPDNGSFIMSAAYVPLDADGLSDFGALSGGVGTKVVRDGFPTILVFRLPADNEVVRLVNLTGAGALRDGGYYRWDGSIWRGYRTMPQRAMDGMNAFASMDPDRIYDYWGSLLGGLQYSLTVDAVSLTQLFDAETVPDEYLGLLGSMLGVSVPQDETPAVRRYLVQTAVPRNRLRGLNHGVALRLFLMGYIGTAKEVWVNPIASDNWTDAIDAPSDVRADIAAKGLVVDPTSGVKGQDWIEVDHATQAAYDALAAGYVPSSRITVYLNNRDGSPISAGMSLSSAEALKQSVATALAEDVLPMQTTVRFFATIQEDASTRYL